MRCPHNHTPMASMWTMLMAFWNTTSIQVRWQLKSQELSLIRQTRKHPTGHFYSGCSCHDVARGVARFKKHEQAPNSVLRSRGPRSSVEAEDIGLQRDLEI